MPTAQFLLALLLAAGTAGSARAEESIVVNPANTVGALGDDQLKDLFLGRKVAWDDGSKVVVVVVKSGPSADALLRRLGKNAQQFQTGWKKLVFTGKAAMPEQVDTDEQMVELVARTPGAIGLVDKAKLKDGVKAVALQ